MIHRNQQLAALAGIAVDALRTLVTEPKTPPHVRLRAIQLILETAGAPGDDDTPGRAMPIPISSQAPARGPVAVPHDKPLAEAGRNHPCPCGSGLKFKKCCLEKKTATSFALPPRSPTLRSAAAASIAGGPGILARAS